MALVNMTPHDVTVVLGSGDTHVYKRGNLVARLDSKRQVRLDVLDDGVNVYSPQRFTKIVVPALPANTTGIIVSMQVGTELDSLPLECPTRTKTPIRVYGPDSSEDGVVRKAGVIVGTRRLVRYGTLNLRDATPTATIEL